MQKNRYKDRAYYRGRTEGVPAGQAALWIPRTIFFPLYALTEFGIRRPLKSLTSVAERKYVPEYIDKIFHPLPNFWWSPAIFADLGVLASGGVQLWLADALVPQNDVVALASTGGLDLWHLAVRDRYTTGAIYFGTLGDYLTRPDRPFYGLGNNSEPWELTYYTQTRGTVVGFLGWLPSNHFRFEVSGGYRFEHMGPGRAPSIEERFNVQSYVPGFGEYFHLIVGNANIIVDSRNNRVLNSGVRWDTHGTYARDIHDREQHWISVETEIEGAIEVIHPGRVLSLSLYAMDTIPLGKKPVPMTDQAILGLYRLPGFLWGRYVGPSAVVATLAYRYPIWEHLDAVWMVGTGNVFGQNFQGFSFSPLAGSLSVGVRTRFNGRDAIEALIALGTRRFDQPFGIEGIRLHFGINPSL